MWGPLKRCMAKAVSRPTTLTRKYAITPLICSNATRRYAHTGVRIENGILVDDEQIELEAAIGSYAQRKKFQTEVQAAIEQANSQHRRLSGYYMRLMKLVCTGSVEDSLSYTERLYIAPSVLRNFVTDFFSYSEANEKHYRGVLRALRRANSPDLVLRLYGAFLDRGFIPGPTELVVAMEAAMSEIEKPLKTARRMEAAAIELDGVEENDPNVIGVYLRYYYEKRLYSLVYPLLDTCKRLGIFDELPIVRSILYGQCLKGDLQVAYEYLERLQALEGKQTKEQYDILLHGFESVGNHKAILAVEEKLKIDRVRPTVEGLRVIMNALGYLDEVSQAMEVFDYIAKTNETAQSVDMSRVFSDISQHVERYGGMAMKRELQRRAANNNWFDTSFGDTGVLNLRHYDHIGVLIPIRHALEFVHKGILRPELMYQYQASSYRILFPDDEELCKTVHNFLLPISSHLPLQVKERYCRVRRKDMIGYVRRENTLPPNLSEEIAVNPAFISFGDTGPNDRPTGNGGRADNDYAEAAAMKQLKDQAKALQMNKK